MAYARNPYGFGSLSNSTSLFNQQLANPYWLEPSADYYNTSSLLPQFFGWPGLSALHTASGAPSVTPGFSRFDISRLPYDGERSEELVPAEKFEGSDEQEYKQSKKKKKTRKTYAKDKSSSRKSHRTDRKRISDRQAHAYEDEDEEVIRSSENHLESVEYSEEEGKTKREKKKTKQQQRKPAKKAAKPRPNTRLLDRQSSNYGSSSTGSNADGRTNHHHHHNHESSSDDQSCFCTIGKVGYMEPSYHPKPATSYGHNGGDKDPALLGYSIGIPVTAGVLALMTGIAAFLIALALQGVGREGNVVLKEMWKNEGSRDGLSELKTDLGLLSSTTTTEAPMQPARRTPSSAFAPHRNQQHRRMRRNLAAPRHRPVIWLVPVIL